MNTKPRTTRRRNVSITDADYALLQKLGNGNASEGIRQALRSSPTCFAQAGNQDNRQDINQGSDTA